MTTPGSPATSRLPRSLSIVGSIVVLPILMAILAFALAMLTRMLVEREMQPGLHGPTFWVWFAICMAGIALPIIVLEVRGSGETAELPEGGTAKLPDEKLRTADVEFPTPGRTSAPYDETTIVPRSPLHRRLTKVAGVLIGLLVVSIVALLSWRALSDAGIGPDIDDHSWAMTLGPGVVLAGPFVIWGWFGLLSYVRMHEARDLAAPVATKARADFWFFGVCSALVMIFLGGVSTMAMWVSSDGFLPTLVVLAVTGLFCLVAWTSIDRWRATQR